VDPVFERLKKVGYNRSYFFEDGVEKKYEGFAGFSRGFMESKIYQEVAQAVTTLFYDRGVKSILVCGCSSGEEVIWMFDRGFDAWGIDIADIVLDAGHPRLKQGTITDMRMFSSNRFDLVTAFDVLEHIPSDYVDKAVEEISRVNKRFVYTIIPCPHRNTEPPFMRSSEDGIFEHYVFQPIDYWLGKFEQYGYSEIDMGFPCFVRPFNLPRDKHTHLMLEKQGSLTIRG